MAIDCINLEKSFGSRKVIAGLNLRIKDNEFVVVVGPSGCGKTTLLSMLAGFEKPSGGEILIDGQRIVGPGRDRGFVFQDYALFFWKTVLGNVMSGIRDKKNAKQIAMKFIRKVGLEEFANEYPHRLSGGMKQRVGLARALAYEPAVLLMDEPFGALDAQTRKLMQRELLRILKTMSKTIVFVTHSVIEAVYLADRVVVLSKRPAGIVYETTIEIKGERSFTNHKFLEYRNKILKFLDHETGI
jgi:NitT/TauT family transport system ATP-binding protein